MARRTITTTGRGRAGRRPDVGDVRVGIGLTRPTATAARAAAAATMATVVAAVRAQGVADADIRTAWIHLGATWEYPPDRAPTLSGYQATNQLRIVVRDVDRVADVVDAAIEAGATTLDAVELGLADATAAVASLEALGAAVEDARARAEALAAPAGLVLTGALTIEEAAPGGVFPGAKLARMELAAGDTPTPVLPGTSDIETVVRATFATKPAEHAATD